jgi:hypothetical protein
MDGVLAACGFVIVSAQIFVLNPAKKNANASNPTLLNDIE